jgi:hypothetical protein
VLLLDGQRPYEWGGMFSQSSAVSSWLFAELNFHFLDAEIFGEEFDL